MASALPEVGRLLSAAPNDLLLTASALRAAPDACKIRDHDPTALFPQALHAKAALAGLLLRLGCWSESHSVAQDLNTPEGSYWHGILHRIEPDSSNARYWFRRVGEHAIYPELSHRAGEILKNGGPPYWRIKSAWDPFQFVDWCEEAHEEGGPAESTAIQIQMAEWQLLFDWCCGRDPEVTN